MRALQIPSRYVDIMLVIFKAIELMRIRLIDYKQQQIMSLEKEWYGTFLSDDILLAIIIKSSFPDTFGGNIWICLLIFTGSVNLHIVYKIFYRYPLIWENDTSCCPSSQLLGTISKKTYNVMVRETLKNVLWASKRFYIKMFPFDVLIIS